MFVLNVEVHNFIEFVHKIWPRKMFKVSFGIYRTSSSRLTKTTCSRRAVTIGISFRLLPAFVDAGTI